MSKLTLLPKEKEALDQLTSDLRNLLQENLDQILIFGSKVRGEAKPGSDIDLLVVVKDLNYELREEVYSVVLENELKYNSLFSVKIMSDFEFKRNLKLGSLFIKNVQSEGIAL